MAKERKLNVNVTISPNTSTIVTEVLLKFFDTHKYEVLKIIKEDKLKTNKA